MKRLQTIIDKKRIAFVDVELPASGFKEYRCDSQESLGINFATFTKVLNCTNDDDIVTIKVSDYMHVLYLVCEAPRRWLLVYHGRGLVYERHHQQIMTEP